MPMTLGEILEQVDIQVPNSLPTRIKVGFINRIIEEYYRDHPVPDAVYPFLTIPGQAFYELPASCPEDRIVSVVVDNIAYTYRGHRDPVSLYTWTITAESLELFPIPEQEVWSFVFFRPRPTGLTEDDLQVIPQFAHDFQEMLVWGCCQRVASSLPTPDFQRVSYFEAQFEKVRALADRKLKKASQKRVVVAKPWR